MMIWATHGAALFVGFVLGLVVFAYLLALMQADLNQTFTTSPERITMPRKRKFQLVDGWRNAWRWISVNCMAGAVAVQVTWASLDAEQRAALPSYSATVVTVVLLVLGIIGRMTKQKETDKAP